MRNLCLTAALALAGCAAFEEPIPQPPYVDPNAVAVILPAGSRACVGPGVTPGKCEALDRIAEELNAPALRKAIADAKPGIPRAEAGQ